MERKNLNHFIRASRDKFGNKYDYSLTEYEEARKKLIIGCPIHGFFEIEARNHLRSKTGCIKCSNENKSENQSLNKYHLINQFKEIHGNKYDYSKVNYKNTRTKIIVVCNLKDHGDFKIAPSNHKRGDGCPKCTVENHSNSKNLLGKKIGKLAVLKRIDKEKEGIKAKGFKWLVKCSCGREPWMVSAQLLNRKNPIQSCRVCAIREQANKHKLKRWNEMKDKRFGKLKITRDWGTNKRGIRKVLCICDCGNTHITTAPYILNGQIASCGCIPRGSDSYYDFEKDEKLAKKSTILYFVEVKNKYQKFGITYDMANRSRGEYSKIYFQKTFPRAISRAFELIALEKTSYAKPNLEPEWDTWGGISELRENLDINETINMLQNLIENYQNEDWKVIWKIFNLKKW